MRHVDHFGDDTKAHVEYKRDMNQRLKEITDDRLRDRVIEQLIENGWFVMENWDLNGPNPYIIG